MSMATSLRDHWQTLNARYESRSKREKYFIIAALLGVIIGGGYLGWIEPGLVAAKQLRTELANLEAEQQSLAAQMMALQASLRDPDAENRARLGEVEEKLTALREALNAIEKQLVPPQESLRFLQGVLAQTRGLELRNVRTLPPKPLLFSGKKTESEAAVAAGTNDEAAARANLYQHTLEVTLAGNYLDLLAYLDKLEDDKRRFFWGDFKLIVEQHPTSVLTFKLYTLSLEPIWLSL
ncbi:MAG: hypothetical protein N2441_04770 [Rhodocyclaceae bacterium]|nr:hypothetical protein [Rhodocyclaceae bacterium]